MEQLRALGFAVVPREANSSTSMPENGTVVRRAVLRQGVIVRQPGRHLLRVTVGLPDENRRFIDALQSILGQEPMKEKSSP